MKPIKTLWIYAFILALSITLVSAAPSASNVKVTPESPNAGDDLTCSFDYSSTENYSEQKSTFEWWKNDVNQSINDYTLHRNNLTVNDEWFCKITPSDGLSNGTRTQSTNNVTISTTVQNMKMYVNDSLVWDDVSGYYSGETIVAEFNQQIADALESCTPDVDGICDLSLTFSSDSNGTLNVSNLEIYYELPVVTLKITNLSSLSAPGLANVFEFVIENNGTGSVNNVTWTLDLGDGTTINSTDNTSLAPAETMFVYVEYTYSITGDYTVTANATGIAATFSENNLTAMSTLEFSTNPLSLTGLAEIYSNSSEKMFEFIITSNATSNVSVNWTIDFGDGNVVSSDVDANLSANERLFVYVQHEYASQGEYTVTATARDGTNTASSSISASVLDVDVSDLAVINVSGTARTFEFMVANLRSDNLSDASWGFDTGNGFKFNSSVNVTLVPDEYFYVFIDYDYGTTGGFTVNASARNNSVSDYEVLNVTIS